MTTRYTFSGKGNSFNSVLSSPTSATSYTIQSSGIRNGKPDYISITSSSGNSVILRWIQAGSPATFEIEGERYDVPTIGITEIVHELQSVRRWTIGSKQWRSGYNKPSKTWKVFRVQSGKVEDNPIVTFHQPKASLFGKSEAPSILVEPSVPPEDLLKILLILLWSRRGRMEKGTIGPSGSTQSGIVGLAIGAALSGV